MKNCFFIVFLMLPELLLPATLFKVTCYKSDTLNKNDTITNSSKYFIASYSIIGSASIIGLNSLWYKDYPRSSFHFFNDGNEWLQMDKAGHLTTSYHINRIVYSSLNMSGSKENFNLLFSSGLAIGYLTAIEILDGFSKEWGFSPYDFAANIGGSALFTIQQIKWKEQKFSLKYSFSKSKYAKYRPDLLGKNFAENLIKDYNGQTYWLSANISSLTKSENILPNWLNIAIGYSADGMISGKNYEDYNSFSILEFNRTRQFYLSPDIDFSKIKTKKKTVKTLLNMLNILKLPAPAIEINQHGATKLHCIYF